MYKIYKLKDETKRKIISDISKIINIKYIGSYSYGILFEEIEDRANELLTNEGCFDYVFSRHEMQSLKEERMTFCEDEFEFKLEDDNCGEE